MSLPSNNDANQDLNGVLSKVEDEGQSTTLTEKVEKASFFSLLTKNWVVRILFSIVKWIVGWIIYFPEDRTTKFRDISVQTDDIIQECDCNKEVGESDQEKQKIPTEIINNLANEVKLDIFKYLNFNQLLSFQKTNRYFNSFINEYKNELARDYFDIKIADKSASDRSFVNYEEIDIKRHSYDFSLNDHLKEKWEHAMSERIPLFLSFNGSCEADILLHKYHLTNEECSKKLNRNMFLELPLFPKNIEEMCIVRYWLDKLFRCGYEEAEFDNIIFNPVLIKLLFENEVKELNAKETTLTYLFANFELEAMKFIKDHLRVFSKFCVGFSLCDNTEQCNGIIMDILNEGARFPYVCITTSLHPSILELIENKITTSTTCMSKIEFKVGNWGSVWNFNYLHNREGVKTKQFIQYGDVMYSSSYEVANIDNPNIVFLINYVGRNCTYSGIDFKIERK
uniref:F-box domain-containing protein n=1 Tax=Meloidogyne enterolobii TaxID=390850 RepID=A0A6V7V3Z6_MELEN|nr:unnamed protein product [Meloidogyne enterolobii]